MTSVSITSPEKATKKRPKIARSRLEVASKVVAFQQITSQTQNKISERQAAKLLEVTGKNGLFQWLVGGMLDICALHV